MIALPDEPLPDLAQRVWGLLQSRTPFAAPGAPLTDHADVVLRSSGSSAMAKNVGHTFAAVEWAAQAGLALIGSQRWLLVLSPVSAGGFMTLARSAEPPLVWPGLGARFDGEAIAAWYPGGATAISLVSTQLARLLTAAPTVLQSMAVVLVGGGPLRPALRDRCDDLGIRVISTYGATETLGGCVYDGIPFAGVEVSLRDGQILLDGPNVAASYVPGPRLDHPWPTGDLGRWNDGRLQVLGRMDDLVTVKGVNRHLHEYEAEALRQPGVLEAVAVAVPDDVDGYRVEVFVEDGQHRLPRLPTGKPDRQELLRRARGDSR
ncbi:MAG: AMP-binding protein [Candidatus Nanopelagicales bacterium]